MHKYHHIMLSNLADFLAQLGEKNNEHYKNKFLSKVSVEKTQRDKFENEAEKIEKSINNLFNRELYKKTIWEYNSCKKVMDRLKANGAHLTPEKYTQVNDINEKLIELSTKFGSNISAESNPKLTLNDSEKKILSDLSIDNNGYVALEPGIYHKIMENCPDKNIRLRCYLAKNSVPAGNKDILTSAYELRNQKSRILGYKNALEMELNSAHLNTAEKVSDFVINLQGKLCIIAERNRKKISNYLSECLHDKPEIENELKDPVSSSYYINMYKKTALSFDYSGKYFDIKRVLKSIIEFYSDKLDINIEVRHEDKWINNLPVMSIYKEKRLLGEINLDLYFREGKHPHGTCWLMDRGDFNRQNVILSLTTSFENNDSNMISHSDLITMFHELGHGIHEILNKTRTVNCGGLFAERDLVEVASMYFENYCWEKSLLKDCCDLSDSELDSLISTRNADSGIFWLIQCTLAILDKELNNLEISVDDFNQRFSELLQEKCIPVNMALRWVHQFGYECKYYSYIYSMCYSAQLWANSRSPDHKKRLIHFLEYSSGETLENMFGKLNIDHFINQLD